MAVSAPHIRAGKRSLAALEWLARVGASPLEPLALVGGCGERMMHDHVARLAREGLVRRVPMTRGDGSLVVVTRAGAARVGYAHLGAPRSVAPSSWAHHVGCAWVAASFEVLDLPWVSVAEVALDDYWRSPVTYRDPTGGTRRVLHRPDLGRHLEGGGAAVEVELQRKSRERLRGILTMYANRTMGPDPTLACVIYVTGNPDVTRLVNSVAQTVGLTDRVLQVVALTNVIEQTRERCAQRVA
jgi:hypothetical protein